MRVFLVLAVILVALGATLYALGIFDAPPEKPVVEGGERGGGDTTPNVPLTGLPPTQQPPPEALPLTDDLNVLLLVEFPQRFSVFMTDAFAARRRTAQVPKPDGEGVEQRTTQINTYVWGSGPLETRRPPTDHGDVPPSDVLTGTPLEEMPTPALLSDKGIEVLILHDLDPNVLSEGFWEAVAERVRERGMGLMVVPGVRTGAAMVAHPVLGPLLPVSSVLPLDGGEGVRGAAGAGNVAPFVVTEAGTRHPASRLSQWPEWSRRIWTGGASLDKPWGANFVYPVDGVRDDATVLLEVEQRVGDAVPALIVRTVGAGRVLWMGNWEYGERLAYGVPSTVTAWNALIANQAIWLANR